MDDRISACGTYKDKHVCPRVRLSVLYRYGSFGGGECFLVTDYIVNIFYQSMAYILLDNHVIYLFITLQGLNGVYFSV